jgi:predicted AlkP superfamily pyrophosphatase or phosphodiesterase
MTCAVLLACTAFALAFRADPPPHVVLISIDGLMPSAYAGADAARAPTLKALAQEGAYAQGVVGVLPSVTYPSHTTLITGVAPAVHGIFGNEIFDPEGRANSAWYWYARDIRVPTLTDAARASGLSTAVVFWPVSVGMKVDALVPEFWRPGSNHPSDISLIKALSTPDLVDEMEASRTAPFGFPMTDQDRTDMAGWIVEHRRPRLLLLHLTALDFAQHGSGPGSPRALETLQQMDAHVQTLRQAIARAGFADRTYLAVVSDHGFAPIEQQLQPNALFKQEGLLRVNENGRIAEWQAYFKAEGGSGFVFVKDPSNRSLVERVGQLMEKLRADGSHGIASLWSRADLARLGAYPEAVFGIGMRSGFYTGAGHDALVTRTRNRGGHGFDPTLPELHASFIISGPAAKNRGSLGTVRMSQIAPTLADVLGVTLSPKADQPIALTPAAVSAPVR